MELEADAFGCKAKFSKPMGKVTANILMLSDSLSL